MKFGTSKRRVAVTGVKSIFGHMSVVVLKSLKKFYILETYKNIQSKKQRRDTIKKEDSKEIKIFNDQVWNKSYPSY